MADENIVGGEQEPAPAPDLASFFDDPAPAQAEVEETDEAVEPESEDAEVEAQAEPADDADQEIEIAAQDGGEPTKVKLSELVQSHQQFRSLNASVAQVAERVEQQAAQAVQHRIAQADQWMQQVERELHQAMATVPNLQMPDITLLEPESRSYNPDQYHLEFARYQQGQARRSQIQQHLDGIDAQQARMAEVEVAQFEEAEMRVLARKHPDWVGVNGRIKPEIADRLFKGMAKEYGAPEDKLLEISDHWMILAAEDALKWREMQAGAPAVKAKAAAAPKVTKSQQAPRGSFKLGQDFARDKAAAMKGDDNARRRVLGAFFK